MPDELLTRNESAWATIPPEHTEGPWTPPADPEAFVLPGYDILGRLGGGGMGVVYKARHRLLRREVAVKVLAPELTGDEQALQRFLQEIVALGRLGLDHPNLVRAVDAGESGGRHYLVMECLDGTDLARRVREAGPLPVDRACDYVRQAALGLQHVHERGLVHRDLKPANLFLTRDGQVKILDLGLARLRHRDSEVRRRSMVAPAAGDLTGQGAVFGTVDYMAPEQWANAAGVDVRADLYSLGCTLYHLLAGRPPFPYPPYNTLRQKWEAHAGERPPDVRAVRPDVPAGLSAVLVRLMAKQPRQRFATPAELAAALEPYCARPAVRADAPAAPARSSRRRRWMTGGGSLGVLLVCGILLWGHPRQPSAGRAAPAAGEPIKLGVLFSLTGTMAANGSPSADAALLAIDELNERGGVLGRKVEAAVGDGESDPQRFADGAEGLIAGQKVCAVVGCAASSARKAVLPVVQRYDNLLLYPMQFEGLEESPNVIYLGASPGQQMVPALDFLLGVRGKRRLFLVGSDYVFPRAANAVIRDHVAAKYPDARIVGEKYVPFGSSEVGEIVRAVKEAEPDLIVNTINGDANAAFFRALHQAGLRAERTPVLSFSLGENDLVSLGEMGTGHLAAWSYFQSIDRPENRAFVGRFRARYGSRRVVSDPMEATYAGVRLWAQAAQAAGSTDPREVARAMRGRSLEAPEGRVRIDPDSGYAWRVMRLGRVAPDGQFEILFSSETPLRPEPFPPTRTRAAWGRFLAELQAGWGGRWQAPQP